MKIRIRYENTMTTIDVADEELHFMVEQDLKERQEKATNPKKVAERHPQEIIDEVLNRPEYNVWHRETRHVQSTNCCSTQGDALDLLDFVTEEQRAVPGAIPFLIQTESRQRQKSIYSPVEEKLIKDERLAMLRAFYDYALSELNDDDRELTFRVLVHGEKQVQIANERGVSKAAISKRIKRIKRDLLEAWVNFSNSHGLKVEGKTNNSFEEGGH